VLRGRLAVPDEKQFQHNGPENWNTEGRGAYSASIPGRVFQFQGMNDSLGANPGVRSRSRGGRSGSPKWFRGDFLDIGL